MSHLTMNREPRILILGSFLVLLGVALLLDRFHVVDLRWNPVGWLIAGLFGAYFAADGFIQKKRARVFWGSLLFFVSLYHVLARWNVIDHYSFYTIPVLSIALGLSFATLYAFEPKEYALLIPAALFIGVGVISILWWWEILEWYDIRYAVRTYWPAIFIAWGLAIIFRRRSA